MQERGEHIYTLTELNLDIREALSHTHPDEYWVCAEISECHPNRNGHCYLELIDKDRQGRTTARQRAIIWSNTYNLLQPYFEQVTGQRLTAGIKILVLVTVTYHELYGMSLTIHDINPTYTIGEAARRRAEIIAQLEEDGTINDNKELPLPMLPRRIAIISSSTAAGYGDFIDQLQGNSYGYIFYPVLFTAAMQGDRTETSVIEALNRIHTHIEHFDCVVIIRGGGSTSELSCFDTYPLATNVAQFPLPIIVGIGHERDETVLDYVAAVRVKTPTAAAEWLIERMRLADLAAQAMRQQVVDIVSNRLQQENNRLQQLTAGVPYMVAQRVHNETTKLQNWAHTIGRSTSEKITREHNRLSLMSHLLPERTTTLLRQEQQHLDNLANTIALLSPDATLARGYSLVTHNNKVVRSVDNLPTNTPIEIHMVDGTAQAHITTTSKKHDNE
ncbi:MAG: exodeoxyribonuclease VII large subunit [Bacteroidaceae bacterium]|nr:exodeoxyribonuclease VII large subunit [Bacteroidaceae bacterium]